MTAIDWNVLISKRYTFIATFVHRSGTQILLRDVYRIDGIQFRDHLFLPYTAKFRRLDLKHGDTIRICGKINRYYKRREGYDGIPRHRGILNPQLEITNITSIRKDYSHE